MKKTIYQLFGMMLCYMTAFSVNAQNVGQLTKQTFVAYQWQLNGVDIPNATNQSYIPVENGQYTVVVTNSNLGLSTKIILFTIQNHNSQFN